MAIQILGSQVSGQMKAANLGHPATRLTVFYTRSIVMLRLILSLAMCTTIATAQVPAQSPTGALKTGQFGQLDGSSVAKWSLDEFDGFTRIKIESTPKPWLNILGNGLFGGHRIFLLGNRGDGWEFRVDTAHSSTINTDLRLSGLGTVRSTIHGIGYSTFTFGDDPKRLVQVTYFLEANAEDSEVWLISNPSGVRVTLEYGKKNTSFDRGVALSIRGDHIDEITPATAQGKLAATQRSWQQYLAEAVGQMRVHGVVNPLLLREFIWDTYQVVAMISRDDFSRGSAPPLALRNANMGGTYTILGLDVHGRDTLQMVPALSRFDPQLAREVLLNMARYTDQTGRVCHRRLLSGQPIDRGHSDESYWLVTALVEYLHNTYDLSVLDERAPYLDNELLSEYVLFKDPAWVRQFDTKQLAPARFTAEETPMLEHIRRVVKNVALGPHGLPLMEDGDWNDALNGMPKGESVMNAGLYAYCLLQLSDLWRQLGQAKVDALLGAGSYERDLGEFSQRYETVKKSVNDHAWDGQWYVRGFDNQGKAFGSRVNAEGKIYLNAQSWLILAGIPDGPRTEIMIRSVNQYLRNDDKLSLLAPVYTRPDANIGNITRLPQGSNENGGQWRQCTLWWIVALHQIGKDEDALRLFNQLLLVNADLNRMGTEAYLYNEYLRGPAAADPGSAGQQAHVQQAALVLGTLAELYPQVKVTATFTGHYDFPGSKQEEVLYSFTGTGEKVPWTARWISNPAEYQLSLRAPVVAAP